MTGTVAAAAWMAELAAELARTDGGKSDGERDRTIDRLLAIGMTLDDTALASVDALALGTLVGLLSAARSTTASELAAVHRERIDVDRTVKAITAYVRALS